MAEKITKRTVVSSLIWKFLERGGTQGIQFVLSIILARLVSPDHYGLIALVSIFIQISSVFVTSGFGTALIQQQDVDDTAFSSVFFLGLFVAFCCYLLLFFVAPYIALFYRAESLISILRVLSLSLFFGAINNVQGSLASRTMQFKRFFFSSIGSTAGSGIIGIVLAYKGYGVWALVWQQLSLGVFSCIILWFTVKWRPKLLFSWKKVKGLFSFGWKLLCSALLDTFFSNVYGLIIGRIYSPAQLGIYNKGRNFPNIIATNLDGSIQGVMLPTLSSYNNSIADVKRIARRSISLSAYVLMPCMFGLAAIANPLIEVLLTEKWLGCVPFLQLACISYALYPIHTSNLTAINALGRSDIFLKLEIIKKVVTVVNLVVTIPLGIYAMAIGQVITGFISTFINAYPNKRLMGYSYIEQWKDIFPGFAVSILMGCIVFTFQLLPLPAIICLVVQILVGIIIYVGFSMLFKIESFSYLLSTIKGFKKNAK